MIENGVVTVKKAIPIEMRAGKWGPEEWNDWVQAEVIQELREHDIPVDLVLPSGYSLRLTGWDGSLEDDLNAVYIEASAKLVCATCFGTLNVCENHPHRAWSTPWSCGAGMPCPRCTDGSWFGPKKEG